MGEQLELFSRYAPEGRALVELGDDDPKGPAGLAVTVLQSGSAGNATLIQAGATWLLIDCGLGPRILAGRLAACGCEPGDIAAVLVTHEHSDHLGGCGALAKKHGTPLYMTSGTRRGAGRLLEDARARACVRLLPEAGSLRFAEGRALGAEAALVDLEVEWIPVSHDGRETVCYAVERRGFRFAVLTDLGVVTAPVERLFRSLDAVSLETNHEPEELSRCGYPPRLVARVGGDRGHLSNAQAARLVARCATPRLRTIFLAHISQRANRPEWALEALSPVAGGRALIATRYRAALDTVEF